MKARYAILWASGDDVVAARLEPQAGGFELEARDRRFLVRFDDVLEAKIVRRHAERLRGLPALVLTLAGGSVLRIASLEGAGVLGELAGWIESGGVAVGAA